MKKAFCILLSLVGAVLFISGCGPTRLEMDYGTSHRLQVFNQTLDPAAEKNLTPVYGMDGPAADKALQKYRKEFEKPAPAPKYTINLESGGK
ncbi:MAG: hypothetical protein A4E66_01487 [Syntrophus sp. PtaB.Bin001]|nr:MAG: hypothetical protein A4E66_01487 [Syntrophus sp. PtaB.Bin001]